MNNLQEMEALLSSLAEKVDPAHAAVVVVDMQNDFCSERGAVSGKRDPSAVKAMIPRFKEFLEKARKHKVRLVFIRTEREPGEVKGAAAELLQRRGRKGDSCLRGSWGVEFTPEIQPQKGEAVIIKKTYSAFMDTDLAEKLRRWGIRTLVMTGVATNVCVESSARDGFMLGFYIVFVKDLCGAYEQRLHDTTLANIDEHFGQVVTSEDVLAQWRKPKAV